MRKLTSATHGRRLVGGPHTGHRITPLAARPRRPPVTPRKRYRPAAAELPPALVKLPTAAPRGRPAARRHGLTASPATGLAGRFPLIARRCRGRLRPRSPSTSAAAAKRRRRPDHRGTSRRPEAAIAFAQSLGCGRLGLHGHSLGGRLPRGRAAASCDDRHDRRPTGRCVTTGTNYFTAPRWTS